MYIKEHPDENVREMATRFGCSVHCVYFNLQKYHNNAPVIARKNARKKKHDETYKCIRELYPDYTAEEISAMTGLPKDRIHKVACCIGVHHTEETIRRIGGMLRSGEMKEKKVAGIRRKRAAEKFRIKSGMQKKTKWKFGLNITKREMAERYHLVTTRGYIYDKSYGDFHTLFYNSETRRHTEEKERRLSDKYRFKFLESTELIMSIV